MSLVILYERKGGWAEWMWDCVSTIYKSFCPRRVQRLSRFFCVFCAEKEWRHSHESTNGPTNRPSDFFDKMKLILEKTKKNVGVETLLCSCFSLYVSLYLIVDNLNPVMTTLIFIPSSFHPKKPTLSLSGSYHWKRMYRSKND